MSLGSFVHPALRACYAPVMSDTKTLQDDARDALLRAAKFMAEHAIGQTSEGVNLTFDGKVKALEVASRAYVAATGRAIGDPPPDPG